MKDRLRAIEAELGITSTDVVGNTNHAQYEELKTVESTLNRRLTHLHGQLLALLQDQRRGASSVMGGSNQLLQPYNQFAELVQTSYTWPAETGYSHVVTGYKRQCKCKCYPG